MNRCLNRFIIFLMLCSCLTPGKDVTAQQTFGQYPLQIHPYHKDTLPAEWKRTESFQDEEAMQKFIQAVPDQLRLLGYPLASVDSIWRIDSVTHITVYAGKRIKLATLNTEGIEEKALMAIGYREKQWKDKWLVVERLEQIQEKLISYYANNGYPFATVYLDSIVMEDDVMAARLKVKKSLLYPIDSIRVFGKANIRSSFLQHYLEIYNGSPYNKSKLEQVDKKLSELPFLKIDQPADVSMLGTGSVLNLYLQNKRSSQMSFLIGFLPDSKRGGKLLLTGDVFLDMKNLLGSGENIMIKWQQLQRNSPRLNLGFKLPYIARSHFGVDFSFHLYKKDSSYLQLNAQTGLVYTSSSNRTGKLILQWQQTGLLAGSVDTTKIIQQKKLPDITDANAINAGIQYEFSQTDYKLNPRKGWEGTVQTTVGIKRILENSEVLSIKEPSFNYASLYDSIKGKGYQWRIQLSAAHYFPMGKQSTFRWAVSSGAYFSKHIFRNDMFQIGGFNLMRGFDEESIFADRFLVNALEFRFLTGVNSFLFLFSDVGLTRNSLTEINNNFVSGGMGIVLETKLGMVKVSYAAGKRNDVPFSLREGSKLHFGYTNYF